MELVSGVVIAGGRSRRLGQDKRRLRLWGEAGPMLLEHTLQVLRPLCAELIVVLNDGAQWPTLAAQLVPDLYEDAGALGGIYAGLRAASNPYVLVVAADMPLLNAELLTWMLARPRDYDALLPRSPGESAVRNKLQLEPLHAIYSRACLVPLQATLDAGQRRIITFLDQVRLQVIEPTEWAHIARAEDSFRNINTPDELAAVQSVLGMVQPG